MGAARVHDVLKTLAQKSQPVLPLGYVMDHRAKNHVIVRVVAMLEKQHLATGTQDARGFTKEFLPWAIRGQLVRSKSEAHRVAARIRQRHGKIVREKPIDARVL